MRYLITIIAIGLLFNSGVVFAQTAGNMDEAQQVGEQLLEDSPNIFKQIWQQLEKVAVKIWGYLEKIFGSVFRGIWSALGQEVEKRRPEAEAEFRDELEEMKQDIPETTKTLWERIKELWK